MSAYVRQITINSAGNGGKATNGSWQKDGVAFSGTPLLQQNDTLQVVVTAQGGSQPGSLNGYMIIGPAPEVSASQNDASPFLNGNNQICVQIYPNIGSANGTFTFTPVLTMPNPGQTRRQFELTFVAVDPSSQKQWEEDPEFDTGT